MRKGDAILRQGLTDEQAGRVMVLLLAMGIDAQVLEVGGGLTIAVPAEDIDAARQLVAEEFPYGFERTQPAAPRDPFADTQVAAPQGWFGRGTAAVLAVIGTCVLVFVAAHLGPEGGSRSRLLELGAISWPRVESGEHWRLVAAILIHFNLAHLLANMATMLLVAPPLAHLVGPGRFLLVFFVSGLSGNVFSHELAPTLGLKAGASGAIAGVLGALGGQALRPGRKTRYRSWQILGALFAFYGLLIGFGPGRDNVAHLGGLLAGVILGRLIEPVPEDPALPSASPEPPRPFR